MMLLNSGFAYSAENEFSHWGNWSRIKHNYLLSKKEFLTI